MKYTEFLFHFIQNLIKVEQKLKEILYNRTKSNHNSDTPKWLHPLYITYRTYAALEKEPFLLSEEGSMSEPLETFKQARQKPNIRLYLHNDYSMLFMIVAELSVSISLIIFLNT